MKKIFLLFLFALVSISSAMNITVESGSGLGSTTFGTAIQPFIKITNNDASAFEAKDITVSYYIYEEGITAADLESRIDWCRIGTNANAQSFVNINTYDLTPAITEGAKKANIKIVYSFTGTDVVSSGEFIEIHSALNRTGWGYTFDQTDDYSYLLVSSSTEFVGNSNLAVYDVSTGTGELISGNEPVRAPVTYTLTLNASGDGNGNVTAEPEKTSYTEGEVVHITALPTSSASSFKEWQGLPAGYDKTQSALQINMQGDYNLTAVFLDEVRYPENCGIGNAMKVDGIATFNDDIVIGGGNYSCSLSVSKVNLLKKNAYTNGTAVKNIKLNVEHSHIELSNYSNVVGVPFVRDTTRITAGYIESPTIITEKLKIDTASIKEVVEIGELNEHNNIQDYGNKTSIDDESIELYEHTGTTSNNSIKKISLDIASNKLQIVKDVINPTVKTYKDTTEISSSLIKTTGNIKSGGEGSSFYTRENIDHVLANLPGLNKRLLYEGLICGTHNSSEISSGDKTKLPHGLHINTLSWKWSDDSYGKDNIYYHAGDHKFYTTKSATTEQGEDLAFEIKNDGNIETKFTITAGTLKSNVVETDVVKIKDWTIETPDYVFQSDYKLRSLDDVEKHIREKSHLPEVPSAADMKRDGVDLAEINMILLKKVEELTLYTIEQNKKLEAQGKAIESLVKKINHID